MPLDSRHRTHVLVDGAARAAARSFFKAIGFTDDDLTKPLVGVAHCWIEITPCNWSRRKLAEEVKRGVRDAGGTPIEFNTISVTDGIAMGTEGMKASLVSRDVVADSVELVVRGHLLDAFVGISGCDKTIPGMVMAMGRLNIPSVMLYGRSIAYGEYQGKRLTVQDVFEAIGAFNAGKIDAKKLREARAEHAPGQAHAVVSSPRIRSRLRSRCSAYRPWAGTMFRRLTRRSPRSRMRRASSSWISCKGLEHASIWRLVRQVRTILDRDHRPHGYNLGVNVGSVAGQTVDHAHLHIIPRYPGDVPEPRGGIRWIIPRRARYW